jgi:hypothetical protein
MNVHMLKRGTIHVIHFARNDCGAAQAPAPEDRAPGQHFSFPGPNAEMTTAPTQDEDDELLLSARYGDLDDVRTYADAFGKDALAAARDANGNTALHMAAANGHVGAPRSGTSSADARD